ncbi:MAG: Flagellar Assembly Protein [Firmicutes bacterium]|nr:Flagellar Assembly Protein [Bacillota bacterium]
MSDFVNNLGNLAEVTNGSYQITLDEQGVHLVVYPPKNEGTPVKDADILNDLKGRKISGVNVGLVVRTVKEAAGVAVKIAENSATELAEPEFQILVDRERMEASLTIILPKNSRELTLAEVMEKIHSAGISHGIDEEAIKRVMQRPGSRGVCAKGDRPVDGTDAKLKYFIDMENKGRPMELADGRVDLKDLNLFTVVNEGDLLAEKIIATPGKAGIDVLGQPAYAKSGKDILMPAGKNVRIEDNKLYAAISGQVQFINNKINISPVIEIKGDVDLSTGNVTFVGNVVVRGSIQNGFKVEADGNVDIHGSISGGTAIGKNIVIRGGIQGMQRGEVKALENVTAKFIENGIVTAGSDIIVADAILHSRVNAGKRLIVEGKRGIIAGGHVMAAEEIRAKVVGTHLAVATELEVGVNPEIRQEYQTLRKELKTAEASLDQAQKALTILKSMNQNEMPPEKREMMLKMTKAQFHLAGSIDGMRRRVTEIEHIFEETRFGRIRISDSIFPGAKIVIGTLVKPIREIQKFASFFAEDGEIKVGSFK